MSEQQASTPLAIQYAEVLEERPIGKHDVWIAAELRRLAAVEVERDALRDQVEALSDWRSAIHRAYDRTGKAILFRHEVIEAMEQDAGPNLQPSLTRQAAPGGWKLGHRDGDWREIDHENHQAVMRIVWRMEDDDGPNAALEAQAHAVIDALNAAAPQPEAVTTEPCKGMMCGCTDGLSHSPECQAEHAAAIAGGRFIKDAAARAVGDA